MQVTQRRAWRDQEVDSDGQVRYVKASITSRVRRLLGSRADLQKLITRYPELAPFVPEYVEQPRYLDAVAARLVQTALAGGAIGLAATQVLLDRNDGKLTDKLDISGGLDSTLTVQAFREQLLAISTRSNPVAIVQDVQQEDDLDQVF